MASSLNPLRHDVIAPAFLGGDGLAYRPDLPSCERACAMDGIHDLADRVAVEELDHSTLACELGDPVERRRQRHQEVRPARALGRLEMVRSDHAKPSRLRHRGGKLGRPHLAHRGQLYGQVTANKAGESAADGHGQPWYVIAN